jgi:hypothetical protein
VIVSSFGKGWGWAELRSNSVNKVVPNRSGSIYVYRATPGLLKLGGRIGRLRHHVSHNAAFDGQLSTSVLPSIDIHRPRVVFRQPYFSANTPEVGKRCAVLIGRQAQMHGLRVIRPCEAEEHCLKTILSATSSGRPVLFRRHRKAYPSASLTAWCDASDEESTKQDHGFGV